ncbi:NACHT, LRR and PYD domains-containing protein 1 homolog [Clupea harengus]|uniref:NACHT, LRR and PYD domains-containing protein 1 homolog n=1 Tax=Clupea harengus TaxID=7950 RepID=A0A6P8ER16_CLUHA|nr:NACHT, LRR and PYD domains-containing protein 1 homolog [Clupea harengus]
MEKRCTKPSGKCGEEDDPELDCNQFVEIQMVVEILQVTMDIIRDKKIILTKILSADTYYILQHVQQNKLITDRDYSALKSLPQNTETMSGEVLDKLRDKGEEACQKFIDLLKQQSVLEQYPRLRDVFPDLRQGPGVSAPATPPQDPDHITKINEYKRSICLTYKKVKEYNSLSGENVLLADRYTELLIVETHRKQREREEEIRCRGEHHQQVLKTRDSEAYKRITVDQLFKPDDGGDVPKAVIMQGHSGHGKSFTAQKIMYDWASGKVLKDWFDLVFHLKCKELNEISEACSLVDLLSVTNETVEVLRDSEMKVLFLIDGFDELKFSFEETNTVPPKDPFREAPVEATLGALLKGLLLPNCFLLVTTRSTASDKLSKLLSDCQRFTDILGFTEKGVNEYFKRFFKEELLAKKAFNFVKTNETLYTACSIPVICWIICTVFREQEEEGLDITKELETTTSIFVHFVSILLKHHCQDLSQPAEETLLRSLGQLAERGLQEHQVLFDEKSLSEAFPDPSQANKCNFLCKFLQRKKVKQESMYSFMHLSFQEFFAALQYLMLENEEEALDKLRVLLGNVERFKPVIQFLFGLSNREIYSHLKKQSRPSIQPYLQHWLLSVLQNDRMHEEGMLHILHCLYELHEEDFVRRAMGVWGKIEFDSIPLTRTDCWVLLYCLQCCSTIRSLKLKECNITAEKLRMLQPALSRCQELGLTVESLSDSDVGILISALGKGKILTELRVASSLKPESVEQVLGALSRQKSVGNVRLSVTTITVTTTALCLDFIQNTETCRHLR